jgi:predicted GIY-YIG superfamily endonuclease
MPAFFYILRCAYTRARRPVELIYSESFAAVDGAVRREAQVKCWSAQKKRALAEGANDTLKMLARRRRR